MKKALSLLLVVAMLIGVTACHSGGDDVSSGGGSSALSVDTASTATPAETVTPEPTETPTPIPTARPDGLWNVEGMTVTYSAVLDDGTLVIYDEVTRQLLKYDPEAVAFSTLCEVETDANVTGMYERYPGVVTLMGVAIYIKMPTGEQTKEDSFVKDGVYYQYGGTESTLFGRGTEFDKNEKDGYTWYTCPQTIDGYGEATDKAVCFGRYLVCAYHTVNEGDGTEEETYYVVVYDYETGTLSRCPLDLNWTMYDLDTTLEYVGGTTVLIDGNIIDVTDLPEEGEELKTVDYDFDSFLRKGDTLYYTYDRSVRTLSAEGESQEIYRYTADERVILDYAVTESGRVVVLVDEDPWHVKNGSVYVGDTCVCEEADYLIYADDSNIIVSKDGVLHLIPMP